MIPRLHCTSSRQKAGKHWPKRMNCKDSFSGVGLMMLLFALASQANLFGQGTLVRPSSQVSTHLAFSENNPNGRDGEWKVPAGGPYTIRITAKGAKAPDANGRPGRSGEILFGEFIVNTGQVLVFTTGRSSHENGMDDAGASRVYLKDGPELIYAPGGFERSGAATNLAQSLEGLKAAHVLVRDRRKIAIGNPGEGEVAVDVVNGDGGGGGTPTYVGNAQLGISGGGSSASITCGSQASLSVAIEEINSELQQQTNLNSPYTVIYQANGGSQVTVSGYQSGDAINVSPNATTTYQLVSVTDVNGSSVKPTGGATVNVTCGGGGGSSSATISLSTDGSSSICGGSRTDISVAITGGVAPYSVTYQDGSGNQFNVSSYQSGTDIDVTPGTSTSYSLVSMNDANSQAIPTSELSGTVSITMQNINLGVNNPPPACTPATVDITAPAVTQGSQSGLYFFYSDDLGNPVPNAAAIAIGGTYYIAAYTQNNQFGCYSQLPVTVTINQPPSLVVTNPAPVCAPATVDITAAAVTQGSQPGLYLFYSDDLGNPVPNAAAIATGGTYYIAAYTQNNQFGCYSQLPVTVTINQPPSLVVTNPAPVCAPATVDITAAAVTQGSQSGLYLYYLDQFDNTLPEPAAIPVSGTYFIVGYAQAGQAGCANIQAVTVTVNPVPVVTVTNPAPACVPATIDLTAPSITSGSTGVSTYSYFTDANLQNPVATPTSVGTGNYYIVGSALGCSSAPQELTVVVNPTPRIFAMTGGGSFCAPGSGVAVGLSGSETGVSYQLLLGGAPTGPAVPGNGTAISFGLQATDGTYTVLATKTNTSCSANMSGMATIVANPYPSAAITFVAPAVCSGMAGNLASVTEPSGPTYNYAWTISNGTISGNSNGSSVTFTAGAYDNDGDIEPDRDSDDSVKLMVNVTGNGCTSSGSKEVLINALPFVSSISGSSFVIKGAKITLTDATAGGSWSCSNTSIASLSGGVVTGVSAGTAIISYTVTNLTTGCSNKASKQVSVYNPLSATAIAGHILCNGGTTSITVTASSGSGVYSYSDNNGKSYQNSPTFTVKAGTYTIVVTDQIGEKFTVPGNIVINQPTALILKLVSEKNATSKTAANGSFTVAASGGTGSYLYSDNGGSSYQSSSSFTGLAPKTYPVYATDANGCTVKLNISVGTGSQQASVIIPGDTVMSETSDEDLSSSAVIFPNPSVAGFTLDLKSHNSEPVEIVVMDIMGHTVHHARGDATGHYQFGGNFIKGMYFVEIINKNGVSLLKIIKQ